MEIKNECNYGKMLGAGLEMDEPEYQDLMGGVRMGIVPWSLGIAQDQL